MRVMNTRGRRTDEGERKERKSEESEREVARGDNDDGENKACRVDVAVINTQSRAESVVSSPAVPAARSLCRVVSLPGANAPTRLSTWAYLYLRGSNSPSNPLPSTATTTLKITKNTHGHSVRQECVTEKATKSCIGQV